MRGVQPREEKRQERYWNITLPGAKDHARATAIAAHAERMRLERIRVIANDPKAPRDIRETFQLILPMEERHERTFRELSTAEALKATESDHAAGMMALGLIQPAEVL